MERKIKKNRENIEKSHQNIEKWHIYEEIYRNIVYN